MSRTGTLLAVGAGAAAMYFLDQDRGRGRRVQAREQLAARWRRLRRARDRERRYAQGVAEGLRHHEPAHRPADDQALVDRVKSQLGAVLPLDRINLMAVERVMELRGELDDPARIDEVVEAVRGVPGVEGVTNLMHVTGTPAPMQADARRSTSGPPDG